MPRPYLDTATYSDWDTLTSDPQVRPIFFIFLDFGATTYYPFTAIYDDGWGADLDVTVLGIEFPEDSINGDKSEFSVSLSGLNATLLQDAVNARQDREFPTSNDDIPTCVIDIWFFDEDGSINSQASYTVCCGLMDNCEIVYGPDGAVINMTFQQSPDWLWDRPGEGRYTDAFQKSRGNPSYYTSNPFYNDRGFEFVEALQNWQVHWTQPAAAKKRKKNKKKKKGKAKGGRGRGGHSR